MSKEVEELKAKLAALEEENAKLKNEHFVEGLPDEEIPVGKFAITSSMFLQQPGENAPRYIQAAPDVPAEVRLPLYHYARTKDGKIRKVMTARPGVHPLESGPPPKPVHPLEDARKKGGVQNADQASRKPDKKGRAADR